MTYVYAGLVTLLNALWLILVLFNLPGTWLMLLTAVTANWLHAGDAIFGWTVLAVCAGLAVFGEVLELLLGVKGSRQAGGSRRAAGLALLGAIIGAVLGTPVPVIGTLVGGCLGAFAGSLCGDLWARRSVTASVEAGRGAAIGRFWGTVWKVAIGSVMFVLLAIAAFV